MNKAEKLLSLLVDKEAIAKERVLADIKKNWQKTKRVVQRMAKNHKIKENLKQL